MSRPLIYHTAGCRPFSVSCNRATARTWLVTGRRANSHTQDRTDFTSRRRTLAEHRACRRVPDPSLAVGLRAPMSGCKSSLSSPIIGAGASSSILLVRGRRRGTAVLVLVGRGLQETALAVCCGCWVGGSQLSIVKRTDTHVHIPLKKTHTGDAVHEGFSPPTPYPKLNKCLWIKQRLRMKK